jgi:hypothetical protein
MMRYKNTDERLKDIMRGQVAAIASFIESEKPKAEYLLKRFHASALDEKAYRAAAYFINAEYDMKPGSLVLLMRTSEMLVSELPKTTRENFTDLVVYRFRAYGIALEKGGF